MAEKNDRPLMMGAERFANEVRQGYDANLRYCFILGAGASVASGIPLPKVLMAEWREHLLRYSDKELRRIAVYAGLDYDDKVAPLFADGYVPTSEDYFTFYDLRFAGMPVQAYAYLQGLMDKARPSFGYYALAVLLEDFENKLVVTTNFDSLVEETLSLTHARRPLVVGHESLAPFLGFTESRNRATVVKVHRDLLMHPRNGEDEVSGLDAPLMGSLRKALSSYIPIVIGYAGADQSLMRLLEDMRFDAMYWCVAAGSEDDVDDRIKNLLRNKVADGHLVQIKGFDQAMYLLLDRFVTDRSDKDFKGPNTRIREYMQGRLDDYFEQLKTFTKSSVLLKEDGPATQGADARVIPSRVGSAPAPDLDLSLAVMDDEDRKTLLQNGAKVPQPGSIERYLAARAESGGSNAGEESMRRTKAMPKIPHFKIGLTFTGRYRDPVVRPACEALLTMGYSEDDVFLDEWHEPLVAQIGADALLQEIYRNHCDVVVVLLSPDYAGSDWTGHVEWRAVRNLINTGEADRICLLRVDGTDMDSIDGLYAKSDIAMNVDGKSPQRVARDIVKWIGYRK